MDIWAWLADNILPAILLGMGGLFYTKFDKLANSVDAITSKMAVFQVHMENTNKHIEAIIKKMDKVEEHSEKIAVMQSQILAIKEIDDRLRNVEYVKRSSNS